MRILAEEFYEFVFSKTLHNVLILDSELGICTVNQRGEFKGACQHDGESTRY